MQGCLHEQIRRNLEVYIDDIVVKSKQGSSLIEDLEEMFAWLRWINIKLNLKKCVLGVPKVKLLGFIISEWGIEANPQKILAIAEIGPIRNVKGMHHLMGCLAVLSSFMSWLGEWGLPLYRLLQNSDSFHWTEKTQQALDKLKGLLASPPVLASPTLEEPLLLYITTTTQTVSTILEVERSEPGHTQKVQRLVYYMSKVLSECETRYGHVQKLLYAILITKRKLLHYFQSHPILVVTSYGLGEINSRDSSDKVANWALQLMWFDISYVARLVIKSQALADFIAEWTEAQVAPPLAEPEYWTMYFDGSLTLNGVRGDVVLILLKGDRLQYVLRQQFKATNNVAKYKALINCLQLAVLGASMPKVTLNWSWTRSWNSPAASTHAWRCIAKRSASSRTGSRDLSSTIS
jgi:hypothetical protein